MFKVYLKPIALAFVGVLVLCVAIYFQSQPTPISASGVVTPPDQFSLPMVLTLLGGGSLTAAISKALAIWKQVQPVIGKYIPAPAAVLSTPIQDLADLVEVVEAARAFSQDRSNAMKTQRFINAALQELKDVAVLAGHPEFSVAINAFALKITGIMYPVTPAQAEVPSK